MKERLFTESGIISLRISVALLAVGVRCLKTAALYNAEFSILLRYSKNHGLQLKL
jgi:hypothetical protein